MAKPNKFEHSILSAACRAQEFHIKMTYGASLAYSHESFLQNFVAIELFRETGHWVNVDPSRHKVQNLLTNVGRKPKPEILRQRFDLIVWPKVNSGVKAIIEIKETLSTPPVLRDVEKVSKFLYTSTVIGKRAAGYVLYYTEHSNEKMNAKRTIRRRFDRVHKEMRSKKRAGSQTGIRHDSEKYVSLEEDSQDVQWGWGFALFRC